MSYYPSGRPKKLSWFKAAKLYWQDNKGKVMTAIGMGAYAPIALGNDLAGFVFDDVEIPAAAIMCLVVVFGVNKYRTPPHVEHVVHHYDERPRKQSPTTVVQGEIVYPPQPHPRGGRRYNR